MVLITASYYASCYHFHLGVCHLWRVTLTGDDVALSQLIEAMPAVQGMRELHADLCKGNAQARTQHVAPLYMLIIQYTLH
jgi:hypothetical protein